MNAGMGVAIHRGRPEDFADLSRLIGLCPDAPGWKPEVWRGYLRPGQEDRILLVAAEQTNALCGVLAATCLHGQTELEALLVTPARRRLGIGRALLQSWLTLAQESGFARALLEVREGNRGALELYERAGFAVQGRRPAYYRQPTEDALLMGREAGGGAAVGIPEG